MERRQHARRSAARRLRRTGRVWGRAGVVALLAGRLCPARSAMAECPFPPGPHITIQPRSQSKTPGEPAVFEASAEGQPKVTMQWEVSTDGGEHATPIALANSETLTIEHTSLAENGYE